MRILTIRFKHFSVLVPLTAQPLDLQETRFSPFASIYSLGTRRELFSARCRVRELLAQALARGFRRKLIPMRLIAFMAAMVSVRSTRSFSPNTAAAAA